MTRLIIYTDGAARGNPGPAGLGVAVCDPDGKVVAELSTYLGELTNNQAEYRALIAGLEKALAMGATILNIRADSELMVRQLNGEYKVKNEGIRPLFEQAKGLLSRLQRYTINHVPRELNKHADKLANQAIDSAAL
ncbi:MAG: ribonuclease HI family protein [Deltaproteobacteria bacterium]|nr:ribonuclease HI family protein [Deltaproteobacteria bacterium]